MNMLLLKLFSLLIRFKEMLQLHFLQYAIVTYKTRPQIKNKSFNNQTLRYLNYALFVVYFVLRLFVLAIAYLFKIIKTIILPKDHSISGAIFSFIKILVLLFPLSLSGLYWYLSGDVKPDQLKHYQTLHLYRTATAITDSQGNILGVIPNPLAAPTENSSHSQDADTLFVNKTPDVFWDVIKAQQDKNLSFDYADTGLMDVLLLKKQNYKGLNLLNLIKQPLYSLFGQSTTSQVGLITNIVNNLYTENYFEEHCSIGLFKNLNIRFLNAINHGLSGLCRKTEEIRAARHLFPYLAKFNGLEFKRWTAMHTPPLISGQSLRGIKTVSETIFAKPVSALNEAQQALLAASYLHQIPFISPWDEAQQQQRNENWQQLISFAIKDIQKSYAQPENKTSKIIESLKALQISEKPQLPSPINRYLASLPKDQLKDYGDLVKRKSLFIQDFADLVSKRLAAIYQQLEKNQAVSDIIITLPSMANNRLKNKINQAMQTAINNCRSCFNRLPGKTLQENGALMRVIISDEQGKMVRLYQQGKTDSREIASIAMLPAGILLASLGDKANTRFCDLEYQGIKTLPQALNFSEKSCKKLIKRGRALSFKELIATSKSMPLFYRLLHKKLTIEQLRSLYQDFDLLPTAQKKPATLVELAADLSFGHALAKPSDVHKFAHKITQTLYNSELETDPYLVDQYLIADYGRSIELYSSGSLSSKNKIQHYLKRSSSKRELRKILSAPVYSNAGTLRSFQNIPGARFLFAKSGTSASPNLNTPQAIQDKWAVGAFKINGKKYTFLIFVGAPLTDTQGLGQPISHRMLIYPIINEVIKSLRGF